MFRFTIRDVLWLTMVAAVATAAWVNWSRQRDQNLSLISEVNSLQSKLELARKQQAIIVEIDHRLYLASPNERIEVSRGQDREITVRPLPPLPMPVKAVSTSSR